MKDRGIMSGSVETPLRLRLEVTVVIEPDTDGSFHAFCPGLKGLHVSGQSEGEALQNASEAAHCYVASLVRHGDALPIGPHFSAERMVEDTVPIPQGAWLRHFEIQWPSRDSFGNS